MPYLPVLYTFRRCPYAMRAKMGLVYAEIQFEVREILLKQKPQAMLEVSSKGTVPVLLLNQKIIDESLEILLWAIEQNDPLGWKDYKNDELEQMEILIKENDGSFKTNLDHYKYANRYLDHTQEEYRQRGEIFLNKLEKLFQTRQFLFGDQVSYADIAIFPFVRQFSKVDESWFQLAPYPNLRNWLNFHIESKLFSEIMKKYKPWQPDDQPILFSKNND